MTLLLGSPWPATTTVPAHTPAAPPAHTPAAPPAARAVATVALPAHTAVAPPAARAVATVALPAVTALPRRLLKHPRLMHYNRLAALVLATNLAVLYGATTRPGGWSDIDAPAATSTAALANFALAILIRQQYVVNLLFWLATRAPTHWPLRVRWTLGKVYHFGGLHVGAAVAGTLWYVAFVGSLTYRAAHTPASVSVPVLLTAYAIVALFLAIVITALPAQRERHHNRFERTHRFGGWAALVLLWTQTVLVHARPGDPGALARTPAMWVLAVLSLSIALPWLRLRRVPVSIDCPSSHVAIAQFNYGVTPFAGSSTTVSRNPLREWHAFANVPTPGADGFRLTISRAGDWTGWFIDDAPPRTAGRLGRRRVWVKGIPTAGVANIEVLFRKVVYIATGSGIGPVLPHLLAGEVPARLVWVARSPRRTYGDELVDEILAAEPGAQIWDTATDGKPDMVRLAYQAYRAFGAEAVICISNKPLTWQVVHGLEQRGIPAYGAIWDS